MRVFPTVLLGLAFAITACGTPRPRPRPPLAAEKGARPSARFHSPLAGYTILSRFGARGSRFHTGLDIRGKRGGGDPVKASRAGVVTRAQTMNGYGRLVEIRHADGFSTRYAHLRRYVVRKNQKVKAGDVIGTVGATGRATTEHLHFEILTPAYRFVDPEPLLRQATGKRG